MRTALFLAGLLWLVAMPAVAPAQFSRQGKGSLLTTNMSPILTDIGLMSQKGRLIWNGSGQEWHYGGQLWYRDRDEKIYMTARFEKGKAEPFLTDSRKEAKYWGMPLSDEKYTRSRIEKDREPPGWYYFTIKDPDGKLWYLSSGPKIPENGWPVTLTRDIKQARLIEVHPEE